MVRGHAGVSEQPRTAAVRLRAMLVRIDHDRVAVGDGGERCSGDTIGSVVGDQAEEPAVGGVA